VVRPDSAATTLRNVAQRHGGPSADRNLFQLSIGEERDPLSIGREERVSRAGRARQGRGTQLIETTNIQLRGSRRELRDKREHATVRGQRERGAPKAPDCWKALVA
jgi:hypothetical protein